MSDERKDLPPVSAPNFNERLRETISTYLGNRGSRLDRGLTLRDLTEANIVKLRDGYLAGGGGRPIAGLNANLINYEIDLTPPPAPEALSATTSGNSIQVTIAPQTYRQGHGPAKVIVFGAKYLLADPLPTYASAAVLDEFYGDVHAFPVDPASLYRIWAKSVSADGVESSVAGGTNGVAPVAGLLDDVSIASLTASKIRSGSVTVGQFIQAANYVANVAGWRINGDGTAELSNAVVRGGVYASYGTIGGNVINAAGIQSPSFVYGVSGWRLDVNGSIYAVSGQFSGSITGATGTFSGALSGADITGATGSFSGALAAATGSFAGSLSAATGSFAGSLSAATGTFSGTLTAAAVNAVNTINLAGNSVSVMNAAEGVTSTVATDLYVPAGESMRIAAIAGLAQGSATIWIDGIAEASGVSTAFDVQTGGFGDVSPVFTTYHTGATITAYAIVAGGAGRNVAVAVIHDDAPSSLSKNITALGFLR